MLFKWTPFPWSKLSSTFLSSSSPALSHLSHTNISSALTREAFTPEHCLCTHPLHPNTLSAYSTWALPQSFNITTIHPWHHHFCFTNVHLKPFHLHALFPLHHFPLKFTSTTLSTNSSDTNITTSSIPSGHSCHRNLHHALFPLTIFEFPLFLHVSCTQHTSTLSLSNTSTTSLDYPVMLSTFHYPILMSWGICGTSSMLQSSMGFPPHMLLSGYSLRVLTRGDGDPHIIL